MSAGGSFYVKISIQYQVILGNSPGICRPAWPTPSRDKKLHLTVISDITLKLEIEIYRVFQE